MHGVGRGWMEGAVPSGVPCTRFFCVFLNWSQELDFIIWEMRLQFSGNLPCQWQGLIGRWVCTALKPESFQQGEGQRHVNSWEMGRDTLETPSSLRPVLKGGLNFCRAVIVKVWSFRDLEGFGWRWKCLRKEMKLECHQLVSIRLCWGQRG